LRERVLLEAAFGMPLNAHYKSSGWIFNRLNDAIWSRGNSLKTFADLTGRLMMEAVYLNQVLAGQPFEKTAFA
jgi:hypothetical protein